MPCGCEALDDTIQKMSAGGFGDFISQLSKTLAAANRYLVQCMAGEGIVGIVPSHGDILMALFAHNALPMACIAERIGKDPSTVTSLVKKLIVAGYVVARKDARDKRITVVELTPQGRSLEAGFRRVNEQLYAALSAGLPTESIANAYTVLQRMQENFEERMD